DMQVAVADAGSLHLDQHLRAGRLRRRLVDFLQRRIEIGNLKTLHRVSPERWLLVGPDLATSIPSGQTCLRVAGIQVRGWWQAANCPGATGRNSGISAAHLASARGQRVRKRQPEGGAIGDGGSPTATASAGRISGS